MNFLTRFEKFDPFEELSVLRNQMDRLTNRFFSTENEPLLTSRWAPVTDVVETKDAIVLKAELPGMEEKDIAIEFENGVLTVQGERNVEIDENEKGYRRVERAYGKFFRSFTLPPNVNPEKIDATYKEGLLTIEIPKKEEAKPKKIALNFKKAIEPRKVA
jgi:HSP20 family protein